MKRLRKMREASGLSQIALARRAGVSRMRLQLAEAGEITLRPEEIEVVNRALREVIERRASALRGLLAEQVLMEASKD